MIYKNPVVKGFYPDPSICFADGKYYMVCSSFQYFPGIPLFESENLVNWKQIGYVLTRTNQVMLDKINSSGGVFAPTIRYHNGRFYVVTANDTTNEIFYVYTDDIHSEWSDPIYVDQGGIDPSLYFEKNKCYFMSNGEDDNGVSGVVQVEIDINTGKKLSEAKCIWQGSGGRFLKGPRIYKIGRWYYLLSAEGGTEYGHMITCARSRSLWGRYTRNPNNPVLSNRNKAPYIIQGIGHGEVFLTPVRFGEDGWFTAGEDGTTEETFEIKGDFQQEEKKHYTFENTSWKIDWCYMRKPDPKKYELGWNKATLYGTEINLEDADSPTFLAVRQKEFIFNMSIDIKVSDLENVQRRGEAGITVYMCENEHYDIALRRTEDKSGWECVLKLNIGGIKHIQKAIPVKGDKVKLIVRADNFSYNFSFKDEGENIAKPLGYGYAKYLTSEVSGGYTGVMLGLYAIGGCKAEFDNLDLDYR